MNKPWIGNKPIPIDKKIFKHKIITKLKVEESAPSGIGIEEKPFSESEAEESAPSGIGIEEKPFSESEAEESAPSGIGIEEKPFSESEVEESQPSGIGIEEKPFLESRVEESQPSGIEIEENLFLESGVEESVHSGSGGEENLFSESEVEGNSPTTSIATMPVVLAERTIQIIVEANIPLDPMAIEIKNVLKRVFLTHCKLVPIAFMPVPGKNYRRVIKAKLFVEGYIKKNIEYVADQCNGAVYNRIINILFSECFDLSTGDFITQPLLVVSSNTTSHFINSKSGYLAGVDKTSLGNSVFYNTQPYCELVRANFDEFDFLPCPPNWNESFSALHKIIVLELTLNILQIQQVQV